jgi:hypothetical protein
MENVLAAENVLAESALAARWQFLLGMQHRHDLPAPWCSQSSVQLRDARLGSR